MQRAETAPAGGLRYVERIAQPVVVAIGLARRLAGHDRVPVEASEAPGPIGGHVELSAAVGHPLGQRPPHAARTAEAVERQPGRHPEAAHSGHRAEMRIAVRRHRVGVAQQPDHPGVLEQGKSADRALEQGREAIDVRLHGAAAVVPGHAVPPARGRVGLVATDQHAAGLGLPVDEVVGIAEAGSIAGQFVPGHRLHRHVLVVNRHRGQERAHHRGQLRPPDAGGVDDTWRLDRPRVGVHLADLASRAELDPRHPPAQREAHTELASGIGDRVRGDVRVDVAVVLHPDPAVQRLRRSPREAVEHLLRSEQLRVQAVGGGAAGGAPQVEEAVVARRDSYAADSLEHLEPPVQLDALPAKAHHGRRRVELRDQPGGMMGRAACQLALLHHQHVGPAGLREVIGRGAAHDAPADDDDVRLLDRGARHGSPL